MKDISEKLLVTLWALLAISLVLLCCLRPKTTTCSSFQPEAVLEEDADDFEGEFLQPQVPLVTSNKPQSQPVQHIVMYEGKYFSYGKAFRDGNESHLSSAQSIGLHPGPENRAAAAQMSKLLREIKTNDNYVVEELTHSLPYLVPTAANRLDSIGEEFAEILARNNLPQYRFRVTSVLRSQEDIRRLKRCNANSVSNSPHNYGTTFDIGYAHFDKVSQSTDSMTDDNLKLVLAQTLLNQHRAGHIYVKYECKQGCFHITARN